MISQTLRDFLDPELRLIIDDGGKLLSTVNGIYGVTWKERRNKIFHYFPGQHAPLSFEKAKVIIKQLNDTMEMALNSL